MSLLIIRHGETALNVARVLQPPDTPLSERGIAQAEALARHLGSSGVRAILSSDLLRAAQTAGAIAQATGAPLETTPLLQERNFGDWRGRPYDGMSPFPLTLQEAPPNGESMPEFHRRVAEAFAFALARQQRVGGTIALVTHGLVIRALLESHLRYGDGMSLPDHLGNTSVTLAEAHPPHLIGLLNSTRHLDKGLRDDAHALSGG